MQKKNKYLYIHMYRIKFYEARNLLQNTLYILESIITYNFATFIYTHVRSII